MEEPIITADEKLESTAPQSQDAPRPPEVSKIILPQKNAGPSALSASRRPAGEALEAANALLQAPEAAPGILQRLKDIPQTIANALPDVPALHTYKGDVAQSVEEHNLSLAAIAAAQGRARAQAGEAAAETKARPKRAVALFVEVGLGLLFVIGAIGILAWVYLRARPLPALPITQAPFIYVDQTKALTINPNQSATANMDSLAQALQATNLSVGLVEQLSLTIASTAPNVSTPIDTRALFATFAPQAPDILVRSLSSQFLLGIYSFGGNQPFLVFRTDAYAQAFAGMLAWEYTLPKDLAPLFPYTPGTVTSTAESAAILKSPFVDSVIVNHDARALRDGSGNITLLWSFVDRQTLVVTTNATTLGEIISRLQKAPTITVPQ